MATPSQFTGLLFFSILLSASTASAAAGSSTDFIRTSCRATRYPAVCYQSLSVFASAIQRSPQQLAQTALAVSLSQARSASTFVTKLSTSSGLKNREMAALKDCVENMGDTVDRLSRSADEFKGLGRRGGSSFAWQMSNVQTWVSAALTDENTCVDGFAGHAMDGNVKAKIRSKILSVAQVTSNALALVNKVAGDRKVLKKY